MTIRVRFAPSPTGYLHIGAARAALFNNLYARQKGGKFLLRIEDTDLARSTDESTRSILDGMAWNGLHADEEIVFQSDNADKHRESAVRLLESGKAYRDFTPKEEVSDKTVKEVIVERARQQSEVGKRENPYRDLPKDESDARAISGEPFAIRIGNALARVVSWFRRLLRKPPVTGWGDGAARFRRDTITLVKYRWIRLTLFTVLSQLALFFVLLLSLRHMGVSEHEVSTAEAFAVFAFSRLLSAVPITPGGVGFIDLGYIGGLTAFDTLEKAQIVAAVLLFRALTFGIQIPIGGFTYIVWRVKSDWRRPADVAAQRERVSYFPA